LTVIIITEERATSCRCLGPVMLLPLISLLWWLISQTEKGSTLNSDRKLHVAFCYYLSLYEILTAYLLSIFHRRITCLQRLQKISTTAIMSMSVFIIFINLTW